MENFKPQDHLITLKGSKQYLEVKWRLVWFREDCPEGIITTQLLNDDLEHNRAVFMATVSSFKKDAGIWASATAHGSETKADFTDYLEKAETKAIGRALAALGYGTQFTDESEFDEGKERIVDAPVIKKAAKTTKETKTKKAPTKDEAVRQSIRAQCTSLEWGKEELESFVHQNFKKEVKSLIDEERVELDKKLEEHIKSKGKEAKDAQ